MSEKEILVQSPELIALLGSFKPHLTARAKKFCQLLESKTKKNLNLVDGDGVILKHVLDLVFSPNDRAREGAHRFIGALNIGFEVPKDFCFLDFIDKIKQEGEYHQWMMSEINQKNLHGMKGLQVTIKVLGEQIHKPSGTKTLNGLLSLAEKGFKSETIIMRQETFRAWQVLIDNFALDINILTQPKRIKLITRPLAANNNMNKEPLAQSKFMAWWHFLTKLGPKSSEPTCFETTVLPFLEFCFGKPGNVKAEGKVSSEGSSSPLKKFDQISKLTLEAFGHIMNVKIDKPTLTPLGNDKSLIDSKSFLAHNELFIHSLLEAWNNLKTSDTQGIEVFKGVYVEIAKVASKVASSDKPEAIKAVGSFLTFTHDLLASKLILTYEMSFLFLTVLDEVRTMPSTILCSNTYWSISRPPVEMMLQIMIEGLKMSVFRSNDSLKFTKLYVTTFRSFSKKGCVHKGNSLPFLDMIITHVKKMAGKVETAMELEVFEQIWKVLASQLSEHVERHQEVNQKDSNLEHDLSACLKIIVFPLQHFAQDEKRFKSISKQWGELYKLICTSASMMVTYKALEIESEVVCEISRFIKSNSKVNDVMAKIFSSVIVPELSFQNLISDPSRYLDQLIAGICDITKAVSLTLQNETSSKGATYTCNALGSIMHKSNHLTLTANLINNLIPSLEPFVKSNSLGDEFVEASEAMSTRALTLIQSRYKGSFDKKLVNKIKPFLIATMSHPKRLMSQKAFKMWQVTFASNLATKDIPDEIAGLLRKNLLNSSESSQSNFSTEESDVPAVTFGSFLNRKDENKPATNNSVISKDSIQFLVISKDSIQFFPLRFAGVFQWRQSETGTQVCSFRTCG